MTGTHTGTQDFDMITVAMVSSLELVHSIIGDLLEVMRNAIKRCINCGKPIGDEEVCRFCGYAQKRY